MHTDVSEGDARDLAADYHRRYLALMSVSFSCAEVKGELPAVEVTVFARRGDFEAAANSENTAALARSFGSLLRARPPTVMFSSGRRLGQPLRVTGRKERLFQHEIAHRLTASCFSNLPRWLIEGLAEVVETVYIVDGVVRIGQSPYAFSERFQLSEANDLDILVVPRRKLPGVAELRNLDAESFYDDEPTKMGLNYAGAWALTHMLAFGDDELRAPFRRYLSLLRAAELSEERAWDESFGQFDISARYEAYVDAQKFSTFDVPFDDVQPETKVWTLSDARAREILARTMDWSDPAWALRAERLLDGAGEGSGLDRALVQLALADLALVGARVDKAWAHAEAAYEAEPGDTSVLAAYLGLAVARGDRSVDSAERAYRELRALEPDSADSHLALGEFELARGQTDAAIDRLVRALERHPACWECMELLGDASLARHDAPSAVSLYAKAYNLLPESFGRSRTRVGSKLQDARRVAADPNRRQPLAPAGPD